MNNDSSTRDDALEPLRSGIEPFGTTTPAAHRAEITPAAITPASSTASTHPAPAQAEPPAGRGKRGKPVETALAVGSGAARSKTETGFSVSERDWEKSIPQPGQYDALIISASINPKSDITYLNIDYKIQDQTGQAFTLAEMLILDAKPTNPRYAQSAQGKGRVKAVLEANGKPITFRDIQAVPLALLGCQVRIAVGHKYMEGLPTPTVQGVVGPVHSASD
jgi:hypothetical protein